MASTHAVSGVGNGSPLGTSPGCPQTQQAQPDPAPSPYIPVLLGGHTRAQALQPSAALFSFLPSAPPDSLFAFRNVPEPDPSLSLGTLTLTFHCLLPTYPLTQPGSCFPTLPPTAARPQSLSCSQGLGYLGRHQLGSVLSVSTHTSVHFLPPSTSGSELCTV